MIGKGVRPLLETHQIEFICHKQRRRRRRRGQQRQPAGHRDSGGRAERGKDACNYEGMQGRSSSSSCSTRGHGVRGERQRNSPELREACSVRARRERVRERATGARRGEPKAGTRKHATVEHRCTTTFRERRSTASAGKTRIGRALRLPKCQGKDGRGRCVTQLTLGHDGVDGYEHAAMRTSSEPGGAAVREAGEEEDDGEVAGLDDPRRGRGRRGRSRRRGGRRTCLARRRWPQCTPATWTRSQARSGSGGSEGSGGVFSPGGGGGWRGKP